jgi:hypothetical protein
MPIRAYLNGVTAFEPEAVAAMGRALERACKELEIFADDEDGRRVIAVRIIDLARSGVVDADALAERVIAEGKLSL